jgi:tryptophanyl-tRNA synthetase
MFRLKNRLGLDAKSVRDQIIALGDPKQVTIFANSAMHDLA